MLWACNMPSVSQKQVAGDCQKAVVIPEGRKFKARVLRHEKCFSNGVVLPEAVNIPHQQLQVAIPSNAAKSRAHRHLSRSKRPGSAACWSTSHRQATCNLALYWDLCHSRCCCMTELGGMCCRADGREGLTSLVVVSSK